MKNLTMRKIGRQVLSWLLTVLMIITLVPIMGGKVSFATNTVTFTNEDVFLDTGWADDEFEICFSYITNGVVDKLGIVVFDDYGYSDRIEKTLEGSDRTENTGFYRFLFSIYAIDEDGKELSSDLNRILNEGEVYHWYEYVICDGVEYRSSTHTFVFTKYGSRFVDPVVTYTREDAYLDTGWADDEFDIYLEYQADGTVTDRGIILLNDSDYIEWIDRAPLKPEEAGEGGFATCIYAIDENGDEISGDLSDRILNEGETYYPEFPGLFSNYF